MDLIAHSGLINVLNIEIHAINKPKYGNPTISKMHAIGPHPSKTPPNQISTAQAPRILENCQDTSLIPHAQHPKKETAVMRPWMGTVIRPSFYIRTLSPVLFYRMPLGKSCLTRYLVSDFVFSAVCCGTACYVVGFVPFFLSVCLWLPLELSHACCSLRRTGCELDVATTESSRVPGLAWNSLAYIAGLRHLSTDLAVMVESSELTNSTDSTFTPRYI